jgi:serine/threonine-protein kinase
MASLTPGQKITPSLRLVRPLGAGGMGSVWVADHFGLRTQIAVKFLSEALAANPDSLARFSREAAAASLVKSPHVVHMIDHGVTADHVPYIAMEMLDGEDLGGRLTSQGRLPPGQVATILTQVARALTRAHERGVVHRDIKPDNIFLSDGGGEAFVKVLDFGVAKIDAPELSRTKTGTAVGTPYYMSPEQTMGAKTLDFRTDLWSLGVVAFEALTGRRPFQDTDCYKLFFCLEACPSSASDSGAAGDASADCASACASQYPQAWTGGYGNFLRCYLPACAGSC